MSNRCGKLFTNGDPTHWDCTAARSLLIQQMQFGKKKNTCTCAHSGKGDRC